MAEILPRRLQWLSTPFVHSFCCMTNEVPFILRLILAFYSAAGASKTYETGRRVAGTTPVREAHGISNECN